MKGIRRSKPCWYIYCKNINRQKTKEERVRWLFSLLYTVLNISELIIYPDALLRTHKLCGVCIVFPYVFTYLICLSRFIIKVLSYVFISLVNLQDIWIYFCKSCSKLSWFSMNWILFIGIPWGELNHVSCFYKPFDLTCMLIYFYQSWFTKHSWFMRSC